MSYDPQQPARPVNYVPGGYMSAPQPAMYGQSPTPAPPAGPPQRKSRTVPILVGALVVLLAVAGALAFYLLRANRSATAAAPAHPAAASAKIVPGAAFQMIDETCRMSMPSYDIEDAGHTLNLIVGGPVGMSTDGMTCVFNSLDVPDAVRQHIGTTRALDGQQTDSWDDYTARWTYHPDDGLQMTIREP